MIHYTTVQLRYSLATPEVWCWLTWITCWLSPISGPGNYTHKETGDAAHASWFRIEFGPNSADCLLGDPVRHCNHVGTNLRPQKRGSPLSSHAVPSDAHNNGVLCDVLVGNHVVSPRSSPIRAATHVQARWFA